MLILFGSYRYGRRRVAFRDDFCLTCDRECVSQCVRSLKVAHLFFVPLVPMGLWREWFCLSCGRDPHTRVRPSRTLLMLGVPCLLLASLAAWAMPIEAG